MRIGFCRESVGTQCRPVDRLERQVLTEANYV